MMKRVCVVCEGQSEEAFVSGVMAPVFLSRNLHVAGQTVGTSHGHKGGALSYDRVKKHTRNTLRQSDSPTVTTFFDLYALHTGFPGYAAAQQKGSLAERLKCLEAALHKDIVDYAQCQPERFIPYIQPHELEALLFSDVSALVSIEPGWAGAQQELEDILSGLDSPEDINDGYETKPSARLGKILSPRYKKTSHAPKAAAKAGLSKIEAACPHFAGWLNKLRNIPAE